MWHHSKDLLESLSVLQKELSQARDLLEHSLRDKTLSLPHHTVRGFLADMDEFSRFNEYVQRCSPRRVFEEYVITKAARALTEMKKVDGIIRAITGKDYKHDRS